MAGGSRGGIRLALPLGAQKSIGEDVSRGAMSLGGRNPGVLIAHELLYRACELSLNLNADSALTLKIYERFLQSLELVVKAQTGTGVVAAVATGSDTRISPLTRSSPPYPQNSKGSGILRGQGRIKLCKSPFGAPHSQQMPRKPRHALCLHQSNE